MCIIKLSVCLCLDRFVWWAGVGGVVVESDCVFVATAQSLTCQNVH